MDETMQDHPYSVLVRVDDSGRVKAVNSDAFVHDTDGWVEIDRGFGDRYHHAQGNYFEKPIYDDRGIKRYKAIPFVDAPEGDIIARFFKDDVEYLIFERKQEEMAADYVETEAVPTQLDCIEAQTLYTALMTDTLIEGGVTA